MSSVRHEVAFLLRIAFMHANCPGGIPTEVGVWAARADRLAFATYGRGLSLATIGRLANATIATHGAL